ncbi:hypothetical protein [Shimia sp.]|uniref:hypothetical protein n=1 Tax=Shimia sp. TaxID=1954381 RepID=UPI003B8B4516
MRASQITPEKVRNIIRGVEAAGHEVTRIEIDGVAVVLKDGESKPAENSGESGHGEVNWSAS